MKSEVTLNCYGFIVDRRGPRELEAARALEQARADAALEALWRERVRQNEARRYFAESAVPRYLRPLRAA